MSAKKYYKNIYRRLRDKTYQVMNQNFIDEFFTDEQLKMLVESGQLYLNQKQIGSYVKFSYEITTEIIEQYDLITKEKERKKMMRTKNKQKA